ncbi:hypothetical protein [Shewanella sp. YLB-07]|uniref:hypothetical protein n=1 Tax=Shewanella sp. YLB-07 TaxID=2601268 RepID=UPI00128B454B|nr:hypothetical protein [Shewanella sp. YLB-07]MPY23390.1 hypothetical protein [Shewanella sp. YLB-07]
MSASSSTETVDSTNPKADTSNSIANAEIEQDAKIDQGTQTKQEPVQPRTLKVPITNVYAMGGYCAQLRIGANKEPVNLILDTGSSTLVVSSSDYVEEDDSALIATSFAQEVLYGAGGWDGPVIHTLVGIREDAIDYDLSNGYQLESLTSSNQPIVLDKCPIAIVSSIAQEGTFLDADGILGLAYHQLNKSYDLKGYFEQYNITPALTYPWPFDDEISICETDYQPNVQTALSGSDETALSGTCKESALSTSNNETLSGSCKEHFTSQDLRKFKKFLKQQPTQDVVPYFTNLTQHGLTANKFAFYSRRSSIHVASSAFEDKTSANSDNQKDKTGHKNKFKQLAQDPLNQGWLILGGGEEHTELYEGEFQTISVVEDKYYNVNLISIQVGDQPEIDSQLTDQLEQEQENSLERSLNEDSPELAEGADSGNNEHSPGRNKELALLAAIGLSKETRGRSNAIVDTGVSGIVFTKYLYKAMIESFTAINPKFAELIAPFKEIAHQYQGIDQSQITLSEWPTLTLSFLGEAHHTDVTASSKESALSGTSKESASGGSDETALSGSSLEKSACGGSLLKVHITIKPEHYWQINTPSEGKACFKILSQLPGWPNQSLLGLPLMNDYYLIFDRSAHETGVIRFAKRK